MDEVWKDIKGYEGIYQVSDLGNVKRVNTGRVLKFAETRGYKRLRLSKNGKPKDYQVHRLVAIAFIPNPNNYPQINHKDEVKDNNIVGNLEWCTAKENTNYGTNIQRRAEKYSKPVVQKTKSGEDVKIHKSMHQAERETGINHGDICNCVNGKQKSAGGFVWAVGDYV